MRIVRMRVSAAVFALVCLGAQSQTISYFNQGFLRQPDAASDRRYLAIYGSNIVGVVLLDGTNVLTGTNNFLGALLQNGVPVCTNCLSPSLFVLKSGDSMSGPLATTSHLLLYTSPADLFAALTTTNVWGNVYIGDAVAPMAISVTDPGGIVLASVSYNGTISAPAFIGGSFIGNGAGLTGLPCTCTNIGLATTQYLTDFVIGPITNVYSNGLLVVSGVYFNVILGEDGIDMLGEDGSGIISE